MKWYSDSIDPEVRAKTAKEVDRTMKWLLFGTSAALILITLPRCF